VRVRRKRQRLPSSLLTENASAHASRPLASFVPEAFPIKASDHPDGTRFKLFDAQKLTPQMLVILVQLDDKTITIDMERPAT
jgi:hypothetical protein